jgi:CBS domain-containing protein
MLMKRALSAAAAYAILSAHKEEMMGKRVKTGLMRSDILDRYVERFTGQLAKFQPFLSRKRANASLDDFDEAAEDLISQAFGAASDEAEAYLYAKNGESALLPEEAQENGTQDVLQQSLQQRRQVLAGCLADLELRQQLQRKRQGHATVRATVEEYMSHDVRSIHRASTIKEAGRLLQKYKVGSLLVDDGSRYIGIVTDSDLSRKAVAKGLDPNTTTVMACMSKPVVSIEESESLDEAMTLMKQERIRHLAVTADRTIIGVLSISDLLRAYEGHIRGRT